MAQSLETTYGKLKIGDSFYATDPNITFVKLLKKDGSWPDDTPVTKLKS